MNHQYTDSDQLCRDIAEQSGRTCLLSFSCGKDALGAWLQLRRHFDRIIPYYLYLVPGLGFVEGALAGFEQALGTRIIRLPHPSLYRWLNNMVFTSPDRARSIEDADLPSFDYADLEEELRKDLGLPDVWIGVGVRAVDSPARWGSIQQHGPLNRNRRVFYPVYDWRKARLLEEIEASGIKLPPEYRLFGRSFDGLDYRFLAPIKEHYPADYARILHWFPLADLELSRMEYRREAVA